MMVFNTSLSHRDALLTVISAGLVTHLIFKKTETHNPIHLVGLLLFPLAPFTAILGPHASSIATAALTATLLFWGTLATSIIIYRLSPWHPLAQYPGPVIARISKFYFAFLSLGGKQHEYYAQLHEKYGDIVRVGPNEVSIQNASAVNPLMGPNGLPKGPFWDGRIPEQEPVKPLIAIRNKTEHTRRRRPWTRAFSTAALKGYEPIVTARCQQFVEAVGAQKGWVNLTTWISYFAFDVMNDLAFGGGSEMMRDGDVEGLWHILEGGQKNAIFMSHVPWLGALFLRFPSLAGDLKKFRAYAKKRAITRKKEGSTNRDLFHYLIDEDGVGSQTPTVMEIVSDGALAILAGSDTTSSAITHLFYFLMCNPVAYKRLQEEVDEQGDEIISCAKQAHMPYLNAALSEALRLLPPVMDGTQRAPEKGSGGQMVGPFMIPEGTSAFISQYVLHRDPRCFSPLPNEFLPERWLSAKERERLEPNIFKNRNEFALDTGAFIPFSHGPANCAGKNLGWMEMRMIVSLMVQRYDFHFKEGYDAKQWYKDMMDYFVTIKGVLPTVIVPRK